MLSDQEKRGFGMSLRQRAEDQLPGRRRRVEMPGRGRPGEDDRNRLPSAGRRRGRSARVGGKLDAKILVRLVRRRGAGPPAAGGPAGKGGGGGGGKGGKPGLSFLGVFAGGGVSPPPPPRG